MTAYVDPDARACGCIYIRAAGWWHQVASCPHHVFDQVPRRNPPTDTEPEDIPA